MNDFNMHELAGIVPPLVTPLNDNDEIDLGGLRNVVEHVINGGVHGIFILGTTGELSRLNPEARESLIKNTCAMVNGRIPVLVGITDPSIHESLKLEKLAEKYAADAVVLAPPFYYHVNQDELLEYFKEVAEKSTLPIFLYNMPARTNIVIEIQTVLKAALIPGIIGIKDSSCDFFYLQKLLYELKEFPEFSVFVGPEEIMAQSVQLGAVGGVNGGANLFPELYVQLYEASLKNDIATIKRLQNIVIQISSTLYEVGNGQANFIKILKEALSQKGLCKPNMAKPYIPYSDAEKLQIAECLNQIQFGELVNK
jgi:4-hydroxy-tetrahydrodipicolinate synthase